MIPSRLGRWLLGPAVLATFGILCALGFGNVLYHEGLAGLVSLLVDPGSVLFVLVPYYAAAVLMGAVARWANVYSTQAWSEELQATIR